MYADKNLLSVSKFENNKPILEYIYFGLSQPVSSTQ